jgi:hypothetical protein
MEITQQYGKFETKISLFVPFFFFYAKIKDENEIGGKNRV